MAEPNVDPDAEMRWASAAAAGDRAAAEALLGAVYHQVHAICTRICAHAQDGDDATQEALIAIARALPRFDGRSAVRTWVYRVATNAALDELRRRNRRALPADPHGSEAHGVASSQRSPFDRTGDGPSLDLEVADRLDITDALAALSPEFRAVVVLRDQLGMDYQDIALTLDLPIGTVRSRLNRARSQLRILLTGGNHTDARDVEPPAP